MPYPLKSGKWRAERQIDGKRYSKVCATKREALDWESAVKKAVLAQPEVKTPTVTALEWLNQFLDFSSERHSKICYQQRTRSARLFLSAVSGETDVEDITPHIVLEAMRYAAQRMSNAASNAIRKNLGAAWAWGIKYLGLPVQNPFRVVEQFPVDQSPRRVPTEAEFNLVLDVAQPRDRLFLQACLHTAARKSELFRLKWSDVDFERGVVMLGTRKRKGGGMEYDPVPMTSTLRALLLEQRKEGWNKEYVFCHCNGEPYTNRIRLTRRLCVKAEVEHFCLHAIRHLTATLLAKEGIPMKDIQAILRHKRLATTENYIARMMPRENVLESVLVKRERPETLQRFEPEKSEVPHGGPQFKASSVKLQ